MNILTTTNNTRTVTYIVIHFISKRYGPYNAVLHFIFFSNILLYYIIIKRHHYLNHITCYNTRENFIFTRVSKLSLKTINNQACFDRRYGIQILQCFVIYCTLYLCVILFLYNIYQQLLLELQVFK